MTARVTGILVAIVIGVTTASATAQSLGDVARQEQSRREQLKAPAKVFTNADLPTAAVESSEDAVAAEGEAPAAEGAPAGAAPADGAGSGAQTPAADTPKDDEAGWRGRASQVNGKYAEAQAATRLLKALSDRLGLEMQAANPAIAQRAATERAEVKVKLAEAEQKEATAREALDAFQREARASGVPPAWIQ